VDFALINSNILDEVIVSAERTTNYEKRKEMSVVTMPISKVAAMPSLGENLTS